MGLPKKFFEDLRKEFETAHRPLYFFDDDPDGLASFLLVYRFIGEGKGVPAKAGPTLDDTYAKVVDDYKPDKIFVLDIPIIEQEFLDKVNVPVVWVDHHEPVKRRGVKYFNPKLKSKTGYYPTSYLCYSAVRQDLWIAMVGIVGDYSLLHANDLAKEYPGLIRKNLKDPGKALFSCRIGELTRVFSFALMGANSEAMQHVRTLSRIKDPNEILDQTTPAGKFIYRKYNRFSRMFSKFLEDARGAIDKKSKIILFIYEDDKYSLTKDLAGQLKYENPTKTVIVGRKKDDDVRMSIRGKNIRPVLARALVGIEGYGGGHQNACGANVKVRDLERFVENFKRELKK